ncbi:NAD(P)-dependent oxidoreductase [Alteromonadaceae bacterium BrNp21-10]|nr:NAD(P)-dependent oxidoreductase [Alteromonadaceae bacterium BrNp21-10]
MAVNVAFIGLGVMGFPMAGHLQQNGFNVCVYNRTQAKAQKWLETYQGSMALTPQAAAENAQIVFVCVGNDDDVRSVVLGEEGALAGMTANTIMVDHSTVSADVARELFSICQSKNIGFLDAPVSGGQAGAENGQLTVMVGGQQQDFDGAYQAIQSYSRCCKLLGEAGSGQLAKMMNQICIAGVVQGLAEALHFGKTAGMDCAAVIEVISQGAAQSWQMQNRYHSMLNDHYEHGFAVDWMRKDLAIALNEAKRNGSTLPVTALVDQFYGEVQKMGGQRWDTSSLLARLQR